MTDPQQLLINSYCSQGSAFLIDHCGRETDVLAEEAFGSQRSSLTFGWVEIAASLVAAQEMRALDCLCKVDR